MIENSKKNDLSVNEIDPGPFNDPESINEYPNLPVTDNELNNLSEQEKEGKKEKVDDVDDVEEEQQLEVYASDESNENYDSDVTDDSDDSDDSDVSDESEEEYNPRSLSDIIIQEIENGTYVCLVCTSEIDRSCQIWSCESCFRVYDLDCIKDWAIRGSSTKNRKWRCPACNIEVNKIPKKFTCWCGKVENPNGNDSLIPFSCGNMCNYKYDSCIHSCSSICHPAQHPVCGALGPVMNCNCGNHQRQVPCIITPYQLGWNCQDKCDLEICDLGHHCKKPCHSGFCGECNEIITGSCYCGKNNLEIKCKDKFLKKCNNDRIGYGYCEDTTKVYYDCKIHFDLLECQPPVNDIKICKFSPDIKNTCYCGKTIADNRTKCTDPIPECELVCGKLMECGCRCELKCHEGPCECFNMIPIKCRCQNYSYLITCKSYQQGYIPKCKHKCDALLSCRRHYHKTECCEFEKTALDRERLRKKQIRNKLVSNVVQDLMSIEPIHICTKNCNRLKSCQLHQCTALCHAGPCEPCLESTNDDLVCNCGKTVIPAPVRCGTKIKCIEQCIRPKPCGHRPEVHQCHESGNCPPCTERITRKCECGATDMKNILCSAPTPKCSFICREKKPCGHECLTACSKNCVNGIHSRNCSLVCKKIRKLCPHRCQQKCHFGKFNCDDKSCNELVELRCDCDRIIEKIRCGASIDSESSINSKLHCDDECERIKRDNELKAIFNNTTSPSPPLNNTEYSEYVIETFKRQNNWCLMIEGFLRDLINNDNKKFHRFQPLNHLQRRFIHELSSIYKLYSESLDPEPNRTVYVYITKYTELPNLTITQYMTEQNKLKEIEDLNRQVAQQKLNEELFNSIIIEDVFFGVTQDKLESIIDPHLSQYNLQGKLSLQFIQLKFILLYEGDDLNIDIENNLYLLMKFLKQKFRVDSIAFDCKLSLVRSNTILKIDSKLMKPVNDTVKLENAENKFDILSEEIEEQEVVEDEVNDQNEREIDQI